MTGHQLRLPKPGGEWRPDPGRNGLQHRAGNPWHQVRPPRRNHRCVAQSKLVWTVDTPHGTHVAALRWCACGSVTYPGVSGRWLGKNVRRRYCGAVLPAWHRAMTDLHHGPATVFARPRDPLVPGDTTEITQTSMTGQTTVETPSPPSPPLVPCPEPAPVTSVALTVAGRGRSAA